MTADDATAVAILGTGIMGFPMARNAAAAGLRVAAWNRTTAKARPLGGHGVRVEAEPAAAVRDADVVATMLSDGEAVRAAITAARPRPGSVWAQMSTIGIAETETCAALADELGVTLLDAPVLGTKQPAEAGQLVVLAAGPDDAIDRCAPLFDAIGRRTVRLEAAGDAQRLKLVANHWVLALVEATAETVALAEALGVEPERWLETIEGGALDSPYARMKTGAIRSRTLEPAFKLVLAVKDARLIVDAAEAAGLDPALARLVVERMAAAVEAGHGEQDMAATYFAAAR